jgi:ubiquitin carboxyl-terminal hydrolase L5
MALARDNILQRIEQYADDGVEYNLIALCRSPLRTIRGNLAVNLQSIIAAEDSLKAMIPDWKAFTESGETSCSLDELQESFSLTRDLIDKANPPESAILRLKEAGSDPRMMIHLHQGLVKEQKSLRDSYMHEVSLIGQADEQAARRREDHTPLIYHAIKALSEAGVLKDIIKDIKQNGEE